MRDLIAAAANARAFRNRVSRRVGRPEGTSNAWQQTQTALAKGFKLAGCDWRIEFAKACMAKDLDMMKFWKDLLPYMITQNPGNRRNGGYRDPSRADDITPATLGTLEQLEQREAPNV